MTAFDARRTPARADLAAAHLAGTVTAPRFVEGTRRRIAVPSTFLRKVPAHDAPFDTEALMGEVVTIYDEQEGWAWGQLEADGYVGYLSGDALGPADPAPTHRVVAVRSFLYPTASIKPPFLAALSLGAAVTVVGTEGKFAKTPQGFLFAAHLAPLGTVAPDPVAIAEQLVGIPYLWGGKSSLGLDCSGLVQLSAAMAGLSLPRDSDMLAAEAGTPLAIGADFSGLRRADLVCWKGHVAMLTADDTIIHANGHHMAVAVEPLRAAVARIEANEYGPPTGFRRIR